MATRLNILLVEDNDALRGATEMVLKGAGHSVLGVPMAEDIDDTPVSAPCDAYLIDVNLPGEDGISLAKRIRAAQPNVIIIMITVRSELDDRLLGYSIGADAYLVKPVDPSELLAVLDSCARRAGIQSRPASTSLQLDSRRSVLIGNATEIELTHTDVMLALALASAPGRRLERWQALQIIDPQEKGLSTSSLEMRITALRRKLIAAGAPNRPIRAIHGWGYMLCCELRVNESA